MHRPGRRCVVISAEIPLAEVWPGGELILIPGADFGAPDCQAVLDHVDGGPQDGAGRVSFRVELGEIALEQLTAGGCIWVRMIGRVPPWQIEVIGPVDPDQPVEVPS